MVRIFNIIYDRFNVLIVPEEFISKYRVIENDGRDLKPL